MAKMGRPSSLTPEIEKTICDALRAGGHIEMATNLAGVGRNTFYEWVKRGAKEKSGPHKNFRDNIKKALAFAEQRYVTLIATAAKDTWQAAAWMLERRFRTRWAKTSDMGGSTNSTNGPTVSAPKVVEREEPSST